MKTALKITCGLLAFFFCVFQPLQANLTASLAGRAAIPANAQAVLFEQAAQTSVCNAEMFDAAGDKWLSAGQYVQAAMDYGKGVACSPGNGILRAKYGEMIYRLGFDGGFALRESLQLEPNNPIFQAMLKGRQLPSQ